ncbi:hypothetical protein COCCADRAFT_10141 [Bipolaris zeicola 26-R-13]|uniref:Uncharacterized protein n=1 Tax=Cochliobolus carbonum (strain 26-R-13) TaxID=930089 RepID=W6XJB3_COCC2|nr:uncharacterized protein COCCADRAFT_10141 [Bipolaris zeicola 26-R-13]EUC27202.1 hypothetical protein COCCADRAFT_10141 [Bipolaris zeicola 26-R-13]
MATTGGIASAIASGGAGGGGKKPNDFRAAGGDKDSALYLYSIKSAKQYILEWLEANKSRPLDTAFVRELAHFIWQLQQQGIPLGEHQRLLAVHRDDDEAYLAASSLRFKGTTPSVHQFFGMGTQRGYYDSNVEAVIQQAAASNRSYAGDSRCNHCKKPTANIQFANCSQSYYQGMLLNWGACNECVLNGGTTKCSFYSRPLVPAGAASPSLQEVLATQSTSRPNHPNFPSPGRRERALSGASRMSIGSPPPDRRSSIGSPPARGSPLGPRGRGAGRGSGPPSGPASPPA